MNARPAIWLLLPLTPVGLVLILVNDGWLNVLGLVIAAAPVLAGGWLWHRRSS